MIFDVDDISEIEEGYEIKLEEKDKEIKRLYHREKELKYFNNILENQNLDKAKEIERLNNIIDKLEIDIEIGTGKYTYDTDYNRGLCDAFIYMNDRIKELKGSDSNE